MLALHELYIRSTASLPANADKRMYDMGTLNIAVGGQASSTIIGELWVTYEIELKKPLVDSNVISSGSLYTDYNNPSPVVANMFGTATTATGNLVLMVSANTITFPVGTFGTFFITCSAVGSPSVFVLNGTPVYSNCQAYTYATTNLRFDVNNPAGFSTSATYCFAVRKTNRDIAGTVTIPTPSLTGTLTAFTMVVNGSTDLS